MKPHAYYNEIDPYAALWIENLILEGVIAYGDVDRRSIEDVRPAELAGYTQCHFFAGLGGWSYALRLAGWPDERPVWTGSCPCQPFSAAGKSAGFADERHLWPAWHWLIAQCRPDTIFGEQVASPAALSWIDLVSTDLENSQYACAPEDLCAASIGTPHIRQRLYWVADRSGAGLEILGEQQARGQRETSQRGGAARLLGVLADNVRNGSQGTESVESADMRRRFADARGTGFWSAAEWLPCRDGKWRPVEPGTFPLAHGVPARVGRLRAYGNAICAPLAAKFVRAYLAC